MNLFSFKNTVSYGPEYRYFSLLRLINLLLIGIVFLSIGLAIYFVYEYVYSTIERANTIVSLRAAVAGDAIDFERVARVEEAWYKKSTTTTLDGIRDPFTAVTSTKR